MARLTGEEVAEAIRKLTDDGLNALRKCHAWGRAIDRWNIDGRHMRSPERLGLVKYSDVDRKWRLTVAGEQVAEVIK